MNFKRDGLEVDVETLHWWKSVGGMLDLTNTFSIVYINYSTLLR